MAVATAAQIKTAASKVLKFSTEQGMPDYYDDLCDTAATFAYQEVLGRLLNRGFRKTEDVNQWDRLYEFTLDLGVWKVISLSGSYEQQPEKFIESIDRREELDKVLLFVNGEHVTASGDRPGTIVYGGVINQNSGVFQLDESDRWDLGIPT